VRALNRAIRQNLRLSNGNFLPFLCYQKKERAEVLREVWGVVVVAVDVGVEVTNETNQIL
jgi:hypothetical protein